MSEPLTRSWWHVLPDFEQVLRRFPWPSMLIVLLMAGMLAAIQDLPLTNGDAMRAAKYTLSDAGVFAGIALVLCATILTLRAERRPVSQWILAALIAGAAVVLFLVTTLSYRGTPLTSRMLALEPWYLAFGALSLALATPATDRTRWQAFIALMVATAAFFSVLWLLDPSLLGSPAPGPLNRHTAQTYATGLLLLLWLAWMPSSASLHAADAPTFTSELLRRLVLPILIIGFAIATAAIALLFLPGPALRGQDNFLELSVPLLWVTLAAIATVQNDAARLGGAGALFLRVAPVFVAATALFHLIAVKLQVWPALLRVEVPGGSRNNYAAGIIGVAALVSLCWYLYARARFDLRGVLMPLGAACLFLSVGPWGAFGFNGIVPLDTSVPRAQFPSPPHVPVQRPGLFDPVAEVEARERLQREQAAIQLQQQQRQARTTNVTPAGRPFAIEGAGRVVVLNQVNLIATGSGVPNSPQAAVSVPMVLGGVTYLLQRPRPNVIEIKTTTGAAATYDLTPLVTAILAAPHDVLQNRTVRFSNTLPPLEPLPGSTLRARLVPFDLTGGIYEQAFERLVFRPMLLFGSAADEPAAP